MILLQRSWPHLPRTGQSEGRALDRGVPCISTPSCVSAHLTKSASFSRPIRVPPSCRWQPTFSEDAAMVCPGTGGSRCSPRCPRSDRRCSDPCSPLGTRSSRTASPRPHVCRTATRPPSSRSWPISRPTPSWMSSKQSSAEPFRLSGGRSWNARSSGSTPMRVCSAACGRSSVPSGRTRKGSFAGRPNESAPHSCRDVPRQYSRA